MVLPFVTSNLAWQASKQGQHHPRVKVPVSAAIVTNAEVPQGTQLLAGLTVDSTRTQASGRSFDDTSPACSRFADFRPLRS